MKKPTVGILASPYINNNSVGKNVFLSQTFIKFFERNNIDVIVIPYNLSKPQFKTILKNIDGLLMPGSQIGNYYDRPEFKEHLKTQKILLKLAKNINKVERLLPILSICHGFQNLMLIETNEEIDKLFIDMKSYYNYKKNPVFTESGKHFKKFYNGSNTLIHNNKLGISPTKINKTKKISLYAKTKDKHGNMFIEIIKHKNFPFYGFQGHPEESSPELLIPYILDIKKSFYNRCIITNKTCKIKKIVSGKTIKCKKTNNLKCRVYNIDRTKYKL
jgi:gamma-glutamyl-gamma-aminobutyrate hydrolase PuuD